MAEKTIGSGKRRSDTWLQITLSEKTLNELLSDLDEFNGNKYVKLNINMQDNPDQYGKDVKVSRDRYKPSGNYTPKSQQVNEQTGEILSELPF